MSRGTTIVTPNNRLSHQLLRDFLRHQNNNVQDKPRCLPYSTLLRDHYQRVRHAYAHQRHPVLLNAHQERLLWQQIIRDNSAYPCTDSLVKEVRDAWTRCQLWSIDVNDSSFLHTQQTRQFQKWHQSFIHSLSMLHAITESQVVPYCIDFPLTPSAPNMIWVSFDDFTPQQRMLQQALAIQGVETHISDLELRQQTPRLYPAQDTEDELEQLILWLNKQLDEKKSRIAVIVPDLHQQALTLERRLSRALLADQFELSMGKALTEYPLVAHALQWLALDKQMLSQHQVRLLFYSPYIGGALSEFSERSKFLEESKLLQEALIPYTKLLTTIEPKTPVLASLLKQLNDYPAHSAPSNWAYLFQERLAALQFPGEYPLNSSAYQYLQRLQSLLNDFPLLAQVQPSMTKEQALHAFTDMAKTTIFQIRKTPSPIQVLGLLEASGCDFDAIWVMGLTDQCLPQKVKLSPFIPMQLQRDKQMPHALPEREVKLAQQLLNRLKKGSQECIFSYPRLMGDTPNLPSPFIRGISLYEPIHDSFLPEKTLVETYQETYQCPRTAEETLAGGTAILAYQAQCPFRAFAAYRLHARSGLKQSTGLNDAERGQVVHKLLEIIWKSIKNQSELLNYDPEDLDQLINHAIDVALSPIIDERICSFPPLIQTIERQRLKTLIHACFLWEQQREPFEIKAVEEAFTYQLAGLDFSVRVDRLDKLPDGSTWVIDYKSRIPSNKPWNEERPEAPQLLLYALLDENINALMFLQLKIGQIICSGISQDKQNIPGLSAIKKDETWTQKREEWHHRLSQLASEFRDGYCPPIPQRDSTCLTCDYKNLCRIRANAS